MSIIKDGAGTGKTLQISSENRALVQAATVTNDLHNNIAYKKVFSLPFNAIDPTGADDHFVYIKNTGVKDLHVTDVRLRSTVIGVVEIHAVSGTASSGTAITPVNRNLGSSNVVTATIATSVDFTGLTSDGILFYIPCEAVNVEQEFKTSSHIILPPGQAMSLLWDTATGALSGVVSIYEDQGVD